MKIEERQQAFETRAKDLGGFIYFKTNGDDDMTQESLEAIWRGLEKSPSATDAYLRTRIRWRTRDVWKLGCSVDTHPVSRKEARICLYKESDPEDEILAECIHDKHLPLDEQVIDKIDCERFLNTLDLTERAIVLGKLQGMYDRDVMKELGIGTKKYRRIKAALRPKIKDYFAS